MPRPQDQEKIIISVFLIIGLAMFGFGIKGVVETKAFKERAVSADGIVVKLERRSVKKKGSKFNYSPVVDYTDHNGIKRQYFSNESQNPPLFNVGERVVVLLDPSDPNNANSIKLDSFRSLYGAHIFYGIMGSVFTLFALVFFFQKSIRK